MSVKQNSSDYIKYYLERHVSTTFESSSDPRLTMFIVHPGIPNCIFATIIILLPPFGIPECTMNIVNLGSVPYSSVSQPPVRGPIPGPGINYTAPREFLLKIVILVF